MYILIKPFKRGCDLILWHWLPTNQIIPHLWWFLVKLNIRFASHLWTHPYHKYTSYNTFQSSRICYFF